MDRLRRDVILIRLIEALRDQGSWCGETHVQKAAYLLQEMAAVPLAFDFILYKHGPFSFELRDELAAMRADGLVSLRVQDPAYGPSIVPGPGADALRKRFPKTLMEHEAHIRFVAQRLDHKSVVELERLGTALFVCKEGGTGTAEARAQRVNAIKPHISVDQALEAVRTVDQWKNEAIGIRSG
jgi:uncharacterized protein YwgA